MGKKKQCKNEKKECPLFRIEVSNRSDLHYKYMADDLFFGEVVHTRKHCTHNKTLYPRKYCTHTQKLKSEIRIHYSNYVGFEKYFATFNYFDNHINIQIQLKC